MTKIKSILKKQNIEESKFEQFASDKKIKRYNYTTLTHPYDVKMQSGDTYCIAEIKVRSEKDCSYFEQYGPFLEFKKIEGMWKEKEKIKEEKGIDVQMLYLNFAKNGVQIFYLDEPWRYEFKWRFLPKDNFDTSIKTWKLVHELKNNQETIITK